MRRGCQQRPETDPLAAATRGQFSGDGDMVQEASVAGSEERRRADSDQHVRMPSRGTFDVDADADHHGSKLHDADA